MYDGPGEAGEVVMLRSHLSLVEQVKAAESNVGSEIVGTKLEKMSRTNPDDGVLMGCERPGVEK